MILRFVAFLILVLVCAGVVTPAEAQNRVRRNVEIEWEANENATAYEIQVTRKDDASKKPLVFKTKVSQWSATIKPGVYIMQVRAFDDRGVPGSWSEGSELLVKLPSVYPVKPEVKQILQSTDEVNHPVTFQWEEVPGASKYVIKVSSEDGLWSYDKELTDTSLTVDVPVASSIKWDVVAYDPKNEEGDRWKLPEFFEVHGPKLKKPVIEKPMSQFIRDIKWTETPYAKKYKYDLNYYNKKKKKWELVESKADHPEPVLPIDSSRPSGSYRLLVQANTDRRASSDYAKVDFKMKGGFRTPASLDTAILRDSITKPTHFYVIASYFATQVSYQFLNADANVAASFDAIGAVGRLGMGYQNPKSQWGAFGIADMSAFSIGGKSFTFTSLELHATRSMRAGNAGQFLLGTGLYMREIPLVQGTLGTGFEGAGKVSTMGPHVGFIYWVPLSDRYGMQVNARAYYSLMGSAPVGDIESSMSYQAGLLGSYRWGSNWMTYAGYAYRSDNVTYSSNFADPLSFAPDGATNDVTFEGHFLNVIFEYSF